MGNNRSKLADELSESNLNNEKSSIPTTPILTPNISKETDEKQNLDPRSPSRHIARTPIEVLSAAADELHTLKLNETKGHLDGSTETPLKTHTVLGIDPRSPTLEFQRTPIVLSASPDKKLPERIRNKNLDKVRKSALLDTPKVNVIPPKLLESSPATPKCNSDAYKRRSLAGLLETNIDFTETDLDTVIKEKYLDKSLPCVPDTVFYSEIIDPRSPTVDFLRTPVQILRKSPEIPEETTNVKVEDEKHYLDQNESEKVCTQEISDVSNTADESEIPLGDQEINSKDLSTSYTHSNKIVEVTQDDSKEDLSNDKPVDTTNSGQTPVKHHSFETKDNVTIIACQTSSTEKPNENISSSFSTQSNLIKSAPVTPNIIKVTPKKSQSEPTTPPVIDLTADVKELDKKLSNLIYEDEDLVVCPKVVTIKDQSRTPLGICNGNDDRKATRKLKVSDKPRKNDKSSKIPVFKEKKIKVQCENTPPKGMKTFKSKKSQWDPKDDTLII